MVRFFAPIQPLVAINWSSQNTLDLWAKDLNVADEERVIRHTIAKSLGEDVNGRIICQSYNLDLSYRNTLTYLPPNLTVHGDLILQNCLMLKSLPDNLWVGRNLVIRSCPAMKYLGKDCYIHENFTLERADFLETLGTGLEVRRDLTIDNCRCLIDLGEISIKGILNLKNIPILRQGEQELIGGQGD